LRPAFVLVLIVLHRESAALSAVWALQRCSALPTSPKQAGAAATVDAVLDALALPAPFEAVTEQTSAWPRSPAAAVYVLFVAPLMGVPSRSHL